MNRNEIRVRRMVAGIAAFALTVATIAITVVAPAGRTIDRDAASAMSGTNQAPVEVAIIPSRIEVIGVRQPQIAASPQRTIEAFPAAQAVRVSGRPQG